MTEDGLSVRRKKLLHRARYRGFKEADILIGGFAEEALPAMTVAELNAFAEILDCNDHDLYDWIIENAPPPPSLDAAILRRMRAFDAAARIRNA
jgi:antitoxin CptB